MPLLRSKLVAPALPDALVERPRLGELLTLGARGPVTLVSAPAGWGKTVLLSWWVRTGGPAGPTAWLSTEPDDDGLRFWPYLHAALSSAGLGLPADREALPRPGGLPHDVFLARLADALARAPRPVVLVLDDLHQVRDPAVPAGLEFLLRHSAARLRLVIGTRTDPPLTLHRRRLSGELVELRAEQLSFTRAEAAQLLARHGLALPAAPLAELYARTEGWPAGLRLATLGGRGRPDGPAAAGDVGGDDDGIADYLVEEVIAGQPVEVRDALLRTSIAERMVGGLVDALTGRSDGERLLAELYRMNVFVVPLGGRPCAYRYHRMFRDLLGAELRRQMPEAIPELHRRAARWHAAQDLPLDALRHALHAQDWRYATDVLVGRWQHLPLYGHDDPPRTAVPAAPGDAVSAHPELALGYAADRLNLRDLEDAEHYLRLADRHRDRLPDDRRDRFALITAAFRLAEAQLSADAGRVRQAAVGTLARARPADPSTEAAPSDEAGRASAATAIALTALGAAQLATGDLAGATSSLEAGVAAAERGALSCQRLAGCSHLALVRALRGELRAAARSAEAVLDLPACPGQPRGVHRAPAYLALALANLHWDRLDDAGASLDRAEAARHPTELPLAASVAVVRAQLLQARGDPAGSYEALLAGRRELGDREVPPYLGHCFAAVEADLRTSCGDTGSAGELLAPFEQAGSAFVAAALARVHLADGDPDAALHALPGWAGEDGQPLSLRLDAGLLEALAARRLGDGRRASRALERVLELAEPEGFRLAFTRAGAPVRELLAEHLDSGTAHWLMANELSAAAGDRSPPVSAPPILGEPLTERELTVLRYLQSILTNVEIASELCVSVNTVKTHVRNIYRKLATTRRRDAVRRARELHLL